jgi:hypothetical protein
MGGALAGRARGGGIAKKTPSTARASLREHHVFVFALHDDMRLKVTS